MNDINLNHVFADLEIQRGRVEAELHAHRWGAWKKLETALRVYKHMSTPASEFAVCWASDLRWVSAVSEEKFLSTARYQGDKWHVPFSGASTCSIDPVFFSEDEDRIKREFEKRFLDTRIQRVERDLVKARRIVVDNKTEIDRLERCLSGEKRLLQQSENTVSSLQRELDQLREQHEAM